jgi:hydrogenase-4 component E
MNPALNELVAQWITLLATLMLVLQLFMVVQKELVTNIRLFALQSVLLATVAALVAGTTEATHVFFAAALTVAGKVLFLPWYLQRLVRQVKISLEAKPLLNAPLAMIFCGGLVLLGYVVARPFMSIEQPLNNVLGVAISQVLAGLFMMINRRKAITQVLALLAAENGIFLAAISLTTYGMPLVVELGVFFDLFIAVMVLGILVYRIRETFSTIDVGRLNSLKG